jgi:glycosyltransferase involved in cell wall biosynthesis
VGSMRILVHSYVPVYPYRDGAGLRLFHISPYLAAEHECDLIQERWAWEQQGEPLSPVGLPADWLERTYGKVWNVQHQPGERLHFGWVWESSGLRRLLSELLSDGRYDVIWSGNDTLPYYLSDRTLRQVPLLISPTDSMHLQYCRGLLQGGHRGRRMRTMVKWVFYAAYQLRHMNRVTYWTMVAERDATNMRILSPRSRIRVIPYGVDCDRFAPGPEKRSEGTVVFAGTLGPGSSNEVALEWFLRKVWPLVAGVEPKAAFTIVGRGPSEKLRRLAALQPRVEVTGYVEDVRPFLWRAAVFALPMRSGAGIKNKLLEAWAAGCPVVSTPLGIEGVRQAHDRGNVLVADGEAAMAARIVELLHGPEMRRALSSEGQKTVAGHYSWSSIYRLIEQYLREIVDARRSGVHASAEA